MPARSDQGPQNLRARLQPDEVDTLDRWAVPAQIVASLLARKWVLPVLAALQTRPLRRFQIAIAVKGVSLRVLTETLQRLEHEGLVARVLIRESEHDVGVGYELTAIGRSVSRPVAALARWYELRNSEIANGQ